MCRIESPTHAFCDTIRRLHAPGGYNHRHTGKRIDVLPVGGRGGLVAGGEGGVSGAPFPAPPFAGLVDFERDLGIGTLGRYHERDVLR